MLFVDLISVRIMLLLVRNALYLKAVISSDAQIAVTRTLDWNLGFFHGSKEDSLEIGE